MNRLKLTRSALDVGKISDFATSKQCGAVSVFVGTTRDSFDGKRVLSLEYEAYEPMALKQLELICKELRQKWIDIVNIVIFHRLGVVDIAEASVVIAISSPHRDTSLNAVAEAIDLLKKRVPIWKKELYEDEHFVWKENKESGVRCRDEDLFSEYKCFVEDTEMIASRLVQISVPEEEIKRRIQCFVEKKRDEIDLCNIMDFSDTKQKENEIETNLIQEGTENNVGKLMTCARVNSTVVKQEFSKCHLKVSRVKNNIGPQTKPDYLNTLDNLMVPARSCKVESHYFDNREGNLISCSSQEYYLLKYPAILKRFGNIEDHLCIPQSQNKNIYHRLKVIEDRLLFLESISPEYSHFMVEKFEVNNRNARDIKSIGMPQYERKKYSVTEIERIAQRYAQHCQNIMD